MTPLSTELPAACTWLVPENLGLNEEQTQHLLLLIGWLQKQETELKPLAQRLLRVSASYPPGASGLMRQLVDRIREEFRSTPRNIILPLLGRIVHYHNRACPGFVLPLPEISIPLPRLIPPFIPDRWGGLARYARWSKRIRKDLKKYGTLRQTSQRNPISDDELAIGRVLTTSILWGGILCRQFLMDFYSILPHWRESSEFIGGRVYITFVDTAGNCRRWLPDPITTLLLLSLPATAERRENITAKQLRSACDRTILGYFRSLGLDQDAPENVPDLLDSALLYFELRLPRALTQIAAGRHVSYSPDAKTWARLTRMTQLRTESCVGAPEGDHEPEIEADPGTTEIASRRSARDSCDWLSDLRRMLGAYDRAMTKADSKHALLSALKTTHLDPAFRLFLQFAVHEISIRAGTTHRLKSICDSVIAVARQLPALVKFEDPRSLSPDTLQGAYSMILDDSSSSSQHRKRAGCLRAFHRFLVEKKLSEEINEHEIFGRSSDAALVDANVITEDEYVDTRDALIPPGQTPSPDEDAQTRYIAGLILILGYRCGLRRLEALKLRPCDLCDDDPAELLIRPWEQRRLKTPNATRKLPVFALLEPYELDLIKGWKREHPEREGKDSRKAFLFSLPASPRAYISERRIFALIHEFLRKSTGDDRVHYHVLRHSGCATWLEFALLRAPTTELPGWLINWPLQSAKLKEDQIGRIRNNLYANDFLTRRHLWAIAQTMGHASPVTSTHSYTHLNWELLGLSLDSHAPCLTVTALAKMAGISRQYASSIISGKPDIPATWKVVAAAWKKGAPVEESSGPLGQNVEGVGRNTGPDAAKDEAESLLDRLWQVLHLHAEHKENSAEDLAVRFGFSEDFVSRLIENAKTAATLTVGEAGFVHKFQTNDQGVRLCCPTPIGSQEQMGVSLRFAPKVFDSLKSPQPACSDLARHYLSQRRNDRNGLEFTWGERRLAVMYAEFLVEIGVSPAEMEIRCFSADNSKWKRLFRPFPALRDLAQTRFGAARPPAPEKAGGNTIGIKISLGGADNQNASTPQASYGFRYTMLLASLSAVATNCSASTSALSLQ